ncbi:MAG: S-layer family protein, partial [Verrucomicrobiaceae bacterium]
MKTRPTTHRVNSVSKKSSGADAPKAKFFAKAFASTIEPLEARIAPATVLVSQTGNDYKLEVSGGGDYRLEEVAGEIRLVEGATVLWDGPLLTSIGNLSLIADANNDILTVAVSSLGGSLSIDTGSGSDILNISGSLQVTGDFDLLSSGTINLQGGINAGSDVTISGYTVAFTSASSDLSLTSGLGKVGITATRNIAMSGGSSISTIGGGVTLEANDGLVSESGNFTGIQVHGGITTVGGNISLTGTGGDTGSSNFGIQLGGAGFLSGNISSTTGSVTLAGTGGQGTGGDNDGIMMHGSSGASISTGGDIRLTGTSGFDSAPILRNEALNFEGGSSITSTGGSITLITDHEFRLGGAINAGSNTVTLLPKTGLEALTVGGSFYDGIEASQLTAIIAGTIQIGDTSTGAITISSDINLPGKTLLIESNLSVTGTAGGIVATTLGISAGGTVNITDTTTDVDTLAIKTTAGNISFTGDADGFTTNAIGPISGITGPGNVTLSSGGPITISGPGLNNNTGTGDVAITSTGSTVTIAGNGIATKGNVSLNSTGNMLVQGGGINVTAGTGTLSLTSDGGISATGNIVAKGAITFLAGGDISHTGSSVSNIGALTGDITITTTGGTILSTAGGIQSVGAVTISAPGNVTVGGSGIDARAGSGDISVTSTGGAVLVEHNGIFGDRHVTLLGNGNVTVGNI